LTKPYRAVAKHSFCVVSDFLKRQLLVGDVTNTIPQIRYYRNSSVQLITG
jgi:hypothetical protein